MKECVPVTAKKTTTLSNNNETHNGDADYPLPAISFCFEDPLPKEIECASPENNHLYSDLDVNNILVSPITTATTTTTTTTEHRRRLSSTSTMTFYSLDGSLAPTIADIVTDDNNNINLDATSTLKETLPKDTIRKKTPDTNPLSPPQHRQDGEEEDEEKFLVFLNQLQEFSGNLEQFVTSDLAEKARPSSFSTKLHSNQTTSKEKTNEEIDLEDGRLAFKKEEQKRMMKLEIEQGRKDTVDDDFIKEIPLSYSPSVPNKPWPNSSSSTSSVSYCNEWWNNATTRILAAIPEEVASVISSIHKNNDGSKYYLQQTRVFCMLLTFTIFLLVILGTIFLLISMILSAKTTIHSNHNNTGTEVATEPSISSVYDEGPLSYDIEKSMDELPKRDQTNIRAPTTILPTGEVFDWKLVGTLSAFAGKTQTFRWVSMDSSGTRIAVGTRDSVQVYQQQQQEGSTSQSFVSWEALGSSIDIRSSSEKLMISGDGNTLAICAPPQIHLYRFHTNHNDWTILGSGFLPADTCSSLDLSWNGTVLAVGDDTRDQDKGMVRIYHYTANDDSNETKWMSQGGPIVGIHAGDMVGSAIALAADGSILAVGIPGSITFAGHVQVFRRNKDHDWVRLGSPLTMEKHSFQGFGSSVALSSNGHEMAVGTASYGNKSKGGQVRVYKWDESDDDWKLKGDTITGDRVKAGVSSVAFMGDNTIAIGGSSYVRMLQVDNLNTEEEWIETALFDFGTNDTHEWSVGGSTLAVVREPSSLQVFQQVASSIGT